MFRTAQNLPRSKAAVKRACDPPWGFWDTIGSVLARIVVCALVGFTASACEGEAIRTFLPFPETEAGAVVFVEGAAPAVTLTGFDLAEASLTVSGDSTRPLSAYFYDETLSELRLASGVLEPTRSERGYRTLSDPKSVWQADLSARAWTASSPDPSVRSQRVAAICPGLTEQVVWTASSTGGRGLLFARGGGLLLGVNDPGAHRWDLLELDDGFGVVSTRTFDGVVTASDMDSDGTLYVSLDDWRVLRVGLDPPQLQLIAELEAPPDKDATFSMSVRGVGEAFQAYLLTQHGRVYRATSAGSEMVAQHGDAFIGSSTGGIVHIGDDVVIAARAQIPDAVRIDHGVPKNETLPFNGFEFRVLESVPDLGVVTVDAFNGRVAVLGSEGWTELGTIATKITALSPVDDGFIYATGDGQLGELSVQLEGQCPPASLIRSVEIGIYRAAPLADRMMLFGTKEGVPTLIAVSMEGL